MLMSFQTIAANYTFTVEPTYTPERAAEVYQPLLDYLKQSTGHQFTLLAPRNHHFFWRDLRQNIATDFVFEEAQFVDYRVQRYQFVPIARTIEDSRYSLIALPEVAERGLDGLIGRRVVCMPSPSLGFAMLAELFTNPVAQPDIRSEAASWRDGVEMIFGDEADAAMVPRYIADLYPNLVEVAQSKTLPGPAISAASSVPEVDRNAVRDALLKLHESAAASQVLAELGITGFKETDASDYAGDEVILKGFFGYQ
jgi:hypothetical protein